MEMLHETTLMREKGHIDKSEGLYYDEEERRLIIADALKSNR